MQRHALMLLTLALLPTFVHGQEAGDSPAPLQGEPVEIARSYTLPSKILDQTRRINVYVPPSYGEGEKRYPVLYLLDGGVKEDFIHIAGIASLAADFRKIREHIVVGIEGIDRYHDLVPPTMIEEDKKRLPTSGGAADETHGTILHPAALAAVREIFGFRVPEG